MSSSAADNSAAQICQLCCSLCCLPINLGMAILLITVAGLHVNDCKIEPGLPIGVIVYGTALLCKTTIKLINDVYLSVLIVKGKSKDQGIRAKVAFLGIDICIFIGFLLLTGFTFALWRPHNEDCNSLFYITTCIYLFLCWILLSLLTLCCCNCALIAYCKKKKVIPDDEQRKI